MRSKLAHNIIHVIHRKWTSQRVYKAIYFNHHPKNDFGLLKSKSLKWLLAFLKISQTDQNTTHLPFNCGAQKSGKSDELCVGPEGCMEILK